MINKKRNTYFITFATRKIKTFIESWSSCYTLIGILHSRTLNSNINGLHEKALKIVYSDFRSTFDNLLEKNTSVSIYIRTLGN